MREIPSLRILCLRAVGPPICDPEVTLSGRPRPRAPTDGNEINSDSDDNNNTNNNENDDTNKSPKRKESSSTTTIRLRVKKRKSVAAENEASFNAPLKEPTLTSRLLRSLRESTLPQQPYSGPSRPNANDVDISHPWTMSIYPTRETVSNAPLITAEAAEADTTGQTIPEFLAIENSNRALECIQVFIDALVESGRAGDSRMGVHFFREWVSAITGLDAMSIPKKESNSKKSKKKKQHRNSVPSVDYDSLPLGSLSLHNFAAGSIKTFKSMEKANVGCCLGTLDVSGVHGLTDSILTNIICGGSFPRLQRLSVKNCRKLTGKGIASLVNVSKLTALDVGGCFNIHPNDILSLVQSHPSTKKGMFTEIYAGGLGWTDVALEELVDVTLGSLKGVGVGFSPYISGPGLILTLSKVASTLDHLAVPFCSGMDEACVSALGKNLPNLAVLDIRGCNKVYSLSGMMEGRAVTDGAASHLFVLGRYSGISNNSLDETLRLYESDRLTCILDGGGTGGGIRR